MLVPYSAAEMFELVDRIELYPQFLPWCGGARALEARADGKTARIDIDYHGVRAHFTTDNVNRAGESIVDHAARRPVPASARRMAFRAARARRLQGRARARLRVRDAPARAGRGPGVRPHREHVHRRVRPAGRGHLSEAVVNVTVVWATPQLQDVVAVELAAGGDDRRCRPPLRTRRAIRPRPGDAPLRAVRRACRGRRQRLRTATGSKSRARSSPIPRSRGHGARALKAACRQGAARRARRREVPPARASLPGGAESRTMPPVRAPLSPSPVRRRAARRVPALRLAPPAAAQDDGRPFVQRTPRPRR